MMDKAEMYCDNCEEWYTIEYIFISELFKLNCPKCHGDHIWFGEIDCDRSGELIMGRGGCRQK